MDNDVTDVDVFIVVSVCVLLDDEIIVFVDGVVRDVAATDDADADAVAVAVSAATAFVVVVVTLQ